MSPMMSPAVYRESTGGARGGRSTTGGAGHGKKRQFNRPGFIVTLVTGVFVALIFWAPLAHTHGTVDLGEDGTTLPHEYDDEFKDMDPAVRMVYEWGDATCHQKASRSYFINGNQMPFCARCTAIFAGMLAGALLTTFVRFELRMWWLVACLLPFAVDGTGQTILHLWESTNIVRLLTGFPAGFITTVALGWMFWDIDDELRRRSLAREPGRGSRRLVK